MSGVEWADAERLTVRGCLDGQPAGIVGGKPAVTRWIFFGQAVRLTDRILAALAPHVEARVRQAKAEAIREAAAYADEHCDYFEPAVSIDGGYGRGGYELGIGDWLRHRAARDAPDV